jgi:DNA-directed RNA polymerase sigma subunit (sigma70/sigma32)
MRKKQTVPEEILQEVDEKPPDAALSMPVSTHTRPVTFDPLRIYLDEIKRYALLSREDEVELAIRYREKGDVQAAYKLITANLCLVVKTL